VYDVFIQREKWHSTRAVLVVGSIHLQNDFGIKGGCFLMNARIHLLPWEEIE